MKSIDYRKLWRLRFQQMEEEKKMGLQDLRKKAVAAARILADQFHAKRVYLFGSVQTQAFFHDWSDVDLAVEGLLPGKYFSALAKLMGFFGGKRVDLLPLEDAPPEVEKQIREKGELLYG